MAVTLLTTTLASAGAATGPSAGDAGGGCRAGAPGVGDDYCPLYGNGGYDVKHYLLKVSYDPATDRLVGVATISAVATQNLCRFNLDFQGMTVRSVTVEGQRARWTRSHDHELTISPKHKLKEGRRFRTVVRYDGVPPTQVDLSVPEEPLPYGWIHTDDGAVVVSEPEGSANWFPLNDHPTDKAAFTFVVTGAGRPGGDLQRPARRPPDPCPVHDLGLGRSRADGAVSGHGHHRPVRPAHLPDSGRAAEVRRGRP